VNVTHAILALMAGAGLAVAGCSLEQRSRRAPPPPAPPVNADQAAITAHLAELEKKIAAMEKRLGHGHGALKAGPILLVDGGGQESVLERLRRLERELAQALEEQLAATELQRLRIEQRYYTLAAGVLRLPAGQSQELIDLQTAVRKQVKEIEQ
jgi:hypothetical protein